MKKAINAIHDYLTRCAETGTIYAFGIPADEVTEEQCSNIAILTGHEVRRDYYDACVAVLGLNPILLDPKKTAEAFINHQKQQINRIYEKMKNG